MIKRIFLVLGVLSTIFIGGCVFFYIYLLPPRGAFGLLIDPLAIPQGQKDKALEIIIKRLKSPYLPVPIKIQQIRFLGKLKDPRAVDSLLESMKREDLACASAGVLGSIGDAKALPALKKMAKSESPSAWCAQSALTGFDSPELFEFYLDALHAKPNGVRAEAVRALKKINSDEAFQAIYGALRDDEVVRSEAGRALVELARPETARKIIDDLRKESDTGMITNYLSILNNLKPEDTREVVTKELDLLIPMRWHLDESVRNLAARLTDPFKTEENARTFQPPPEALNAIEDKAKARERELLETLRNDSIEWFKRRDAAGELSRLGNLDAIPILKEYTQRENFDDRWTGYYLLTSYDNIDILEILKRGEKDPSRTIRQHSTMVRRLRYALTNESFPVNR